MPPEFDSYAREYSELLRDPLRDRFATSPLFFHQRKWSVIQEFFESRGRSMHEASWLDIGCGQGELLRLGQSAFARVAGCDLSQEMLKASEGLEVRLQTTPISLPFDSESFDFVTAVCVYHHVGLSGPRRPHSGRLSRSQARRCFLCYRAQSTEPIHSTHRPPRSSRCQCETAGAFRGKATGGLGGIRLSRYSVLSLPP